MIALVLSYFNIKKGPSILISAPESISEKKIVEIPKVLDLYDNGFSLQVFEAYKSANLQFEIESENRRGGVDTLLISIITDIQYNLNINIAKEILIQIKNEIIDIKDVCKTFHSKEDKIDERYLAKIREILHKHVNLIKSTIQTLERAEIRYQALFKSARDAIFLIDKRSSEILDVNQEGIELMGMKREELISQKFDDVLRLESEESLFNQIVNHNESKQTYLISTFFISQSGKRIGIEINTSTVQIGNEIIIQCIIRNISRRLEIEEKLKKSEEKYRLIFENANDLIKVLNSKFEYEELNANVHKRVLGYSKEELLNDSPYAHLHPEDRKSASLSISKILRKGKGSFQARFKHKNGSIKWLEITAKNFIDSAGNRKVITIARDITERKSIEQKLIKSKEKYQLIIENAFDLITVIDQDLNYHFINESRYKEILGYTKEDLIGESILKFIHPDDIQKVIESRDNAIKTGKTKGNLLRIKNKDGVWLWFESRSRIFIEDEKMLKAVIISRDVTRQITT